MKLQVEYVPTRDIKPYKNNAKLHPTEQIAQIKQSITEFGFNDPIAVWHDTIIEGHGRLIAALELGIETVPIIRLDELTDEQRKAYALVHNKLTMNSGFDIELLNMELTELKGFDFDMEQFGFEIAEEPEKLVIGESTTSAEEKPIEENNPETAAVEVKEHKDDSVAASIPTADTNPHTTVFSANYKSIGMDCNELDALKLMFMNKSVEVCITVRTI